MKRSMQSPCIKKGLYFGLINPLNTFLKGLPWWYTNLFFVAIAYLVSGRALAAITFIGFLFIGATDLWAFSMITLSTVTVSVLICFIVGVPLGILAAYSKTADGILKPILDTMQTMPVFVYLVPVIMLFGGADSGRDRDRDLCHPSFNSLHHTGHPGIT